MKKYLAIAAVIAVLFSSFAGCAEVPSHTTEGASAEAVNDSKAESFVSLPESSSDEPDLSDSSPSSLPEASRTDEDSSESEPASSVSSPETEPGQEYPEYLEQNRLVCRGLSFAGDGELLVSLFDLGSSRPASPVLYDIETRSFLRTELSPDEPGDLTLSPDGGKRAYIADDESFAFTVEDVDSGTVNGFEITSEDIEAVASGAPEGSVKLSSLTFLSTRFLAAEICLTDPMPIRKVFLFIDSETGRPAASAYGDLYFVRCSDERCFILTNLSMTGVEKSEGHALMTLDFSETVDISDIGISSTFACCSTNGKYLLLLQPGNQNSASLKFDVRDARSRELLWSFSVDKTDKLVDYYDIIAAVSDDGLTAAVTSSQGGGIFTATK